MPFRIGFLVFPGFDLLALSGPLAAFDVPNALKDAFVYRSSVLSTTGGAVRSSSGVEVLTTRPGRRTFDTFVVCGGHVLTDADVPEDLCAAVRRAAPTSRRVASICTGAFVLARAGLLDGRRATTHWRVAPELQRRFPRVHVDGDLIFANDGAVWSSAGITTGIDLALAMIDEDFGRELSRAVARQLVVHHQRPGGQSQFSTLLEQRPASDRIGRALAYAREHLHEDLSVDRLAEVACLSRRQFDRAFVAQSGRTPARAVERLRVDAARSRIEHGGESLGSVARAVGFHDPERMRRAFIKTFGFPPQSLRRQTRHDGAPEPRPGPAG